MYKLKYYSLTKKEKEKLKKDFYQTDFGKSINKRLKRLLITGILGILFSIYLFLYNTTKWDIILGILLNLSCIVFIISSFTIRINKLNDFLVSKNKKKK